MKRDKISEAMGKIDDRHLTEALNYNPSAGWKFSFVKIVPIAACLIACVLIGFSILQKNVLSDDSFTNPPVNDPEPPPVDFSEPYPSIVLDGIADLNKMRTMINCTNEKTLSEYLRSIRGGGAQSRKDLISFVALVDSLPYTMLLDGQITYFSLTSGYSTEREKPWRVFQVVRQSKKGDWVRFEYDILADDASKELDNRLERIDSSYILDTPIQNKDKRISVYAEIRETHPSGSGDLIRWLADVDGVCTWIFYYTADGSANTTDLFKNSTICKITD